MADAIRERLYTVEDLLAMPADDPNRYELHKGRLLQMPPPQRNHARLASELQFLLMLFVRQGQLGEVLGQDAGYALFHDPSTGEATLRIPDISFVQTSRIGDKRTKIYVGPPDLAVEIISPSETYRSLREKLHDYFEHGTRLVWLIDPEDRSIEVYTSLADRRLLSGDATLDGGEVLPGFTLKLPDFFKVLD